MDDSFNAKFPSMPLTAGNKISLPDQAFLSAILMRKLGKNKSLAQTEVETEVR